MSLRTRFSAVLTLLIAVLGLTAASTSADASADHATARPAAAKSSIPRTYDAALQHFRQADGGVMKVRRFLTPSGNIYCVIARKGLPKGCEINEGSIKDPAVCSGNPVSKYVGRIEFHNNRATPICNTDTIREPGAPTLPYGTAAKFPTSSVKCLSESIGVTCISLVRTEGFFLHRGEYVIFNAG